VRPVACEAFQPSSRRFTLDLEHARAFAVYVEAGAERRLLAVGLGATST
jgi:hypothetical protein